MYTHAAMDIKTGNYHIILNNNMNVHSIYIFKPAIFFIEVIAPSK
jgi:hypothetical protein